MTPWKRGVQVIGKNVVQQGKTNVHQFCVFAIARANPNNNLSWKGNKQQPKKSHESFGRSASN